MTDYTGAFIWAHDNIYELSLAVLAKLVRLIAPDKNVILAGDHAAAQIAEQVGETLDLADHYRLLREERDACTRAGLAIGRALDEYFLRQAGERIARHFGVPQVGAAYAPIFASVMMGVFRPADSPPVNYAWPDVDRFTADVLLGGSHWSIVWMNGDGSLHKIYRRFWNDPVLGPSPQGFPLLGSEIHRPSTEGPAVQVIEVDGTTRFEAYVENGKRHRDFREGPALFQRVEDKGHIRLVAEYWFSDILHRPAELGPAITVTDDQGHVLQQGHYEHGKRHRDPAQGPAIVETIDIDGEMRRVQEYWQHGEPHRPSSEGPAIIETDLEGNLLLEIYVEHGKRHREESAGPALRIVKKADGEGSFIEEYWENGELHRPSDIGPAHRRVKRGVLVRESYYEHGKLHRNPAEGPAVVETTEVDGAFRHIEEYLQHGELHRPSADGPAVLITDACGTPITIIYSEHGKLHRDPLAGPARIEVYESEGSRVEEYWVEGQLHRPHHAGPAFVSYINGACTNAAFYEHGKYHRDPASGPALLMCSPGMAPGTSSWCLEYYTDGLLHRPESDGPAVIQVSDGAAYEGYYTRGRAHRDGGPASISYDADGHIMSADYWREDEYLGQAPTRHAEGVTHGA